MKPNKPITRTIEVSNQNLKFLARIEVSNQKYKLLGPRIVFAVKKSHCLLRSDLSLRQIVQALIKTIDISKFLAYIYLRAFDQNQIEFLATEKASQFSLNQKSLLKDDRENKIRY